MFKGRWIFRFIDPLDARYILACLYGLNIAWDVIYIMFIDFVTVDYGDGIVYHKFCVSHRAFLLSQINVRQKNYSVDVSFD